MKSSNPLTVPFGTITIPPRARALILEALERRRVSSGQLVREFETRFAGLLGVREAVAVSSGTDAAILALATLHDFGARRGDEVILPALSFVATGNAVVHAGFTPRFVDVQRDTFAVALIPYTLAETTLGVKRPGDPVNVEVDILARYVAGLLGHGDLSEDFLAEHGFC